MAPLTKSAHLQRLLEPTCNLTK